MTSRFLFLTTSPLIYYEHNDLSYRHVGLYKKGGEIHAVFVDLSDVKRVIVDDGDAIAEAHYLMDAKKL